MRTINFSLIVMVAAVSWVSAQDNPTITDDLVQQPFCVDYAAFHDTDSDSLNVEVYYKVYSSLLPFQRWGDKYKAGYAVDIVINKKGKQVTGVSNDGELVADDYEETISKDDFVINKVVFRLIPDDYQLIAKLSDPNSRELFPSVKADLKLKNFRRKISELSSIEFVREATPITDDSQFVRSDWRLIPSVTRIYGDEEPELIFFYEIYAAVDFHGDYMAEYEIREGDKHKLQDTTMFPSNGRATGHLERLNVSDLPAGEYTLHSTVTSPGNDVRLERKEEFKIGWSASGMVKNDFKTAVEQLRYIATSEEMKQLTEAPDSQRVGEWNEFWKQHDPTPGTIDNEKKDEYYKRLRYADINFGHFGRDGWKTDMGMVYVTYGPPDEIELHPFDIDSKPYQIWFYYNMRRVFRFVDLNGYGEYELIYPYDGDMRKLR